MASMAVLSLWLLGLLGLLAAALAASTTPAADDPAYELRFPDGFMFSTATASYQIEGAWNASGKGEGMWDHYLHKYPDLVADRSNGDVACDSYHKYKEDIQLVKEIGAGYYRFSLSWPRLLPSGAVDEVNEDGVLYYNAVIDECLANGIQPVVTMFHWDLPQPLQELGGLTNEVIADYFVDFAELVFTKFGDRVKWWITMNEPQTICSHGYGIGIKVPLVHAPGRGEYLCGHTVLKAHARAYRLYDARFRATQQGKVAIAVTNWAFWPKDPNNADDVAAADRWQNFGLGWMLNPIFGKEGDYPAVMKEYVKDASDRQGLARSRLPTFSPTEIDMIRGSADFLALNSYSSRLVASAPAAAGQPRSISMEDDAQIVESIDPAWETTAPPMRSVVPQGMRRLLNWISGQYGNPPVFITENGYGDDGSLKDVGRCDYYRRYMLEVLKAIHDDQCNVIGYTAWTLMDNFEWMYGYTLHYGLFHVDFSDPARPRSPKMSSKLYAKITQTRQVPRDNPDFPDNAPSGGQRCAPSAGLALLLAAVGTALLATTVQRPTAL